MLLNNFSSVIFFKLEALRIEAFKKYSELKVFKSFSFNRGTLIRVDTPTSLKDEFNLHRPLQIPLNILE